MAAEDTELPWDDQTDNFIDAIDEINDSEKKSDIGLRDLLMDSEKYIGKEDTGQKIEVLQSLADDYFKSLLSGLQEEQKTLDQALASADMYYSKIDDVISTKSASARVPYVKPYYVYTNPDEREEILVEEYVEELDALIGKIINSTNYIANLSGSYKEHKFGSWLFSGSKNYILTIRAPASIIMDIERSRETITGMLTSIAESAKQAQKG
jgi:hypothetical protein